jgi:hypothetical protein
MVNDRIVYDFKKANFGEIVNELSNFDWNIFDNVKDINEQARLFSEILNDIFKKHVPSRIVKKNRFKKPWFNRTLMNLQNRRDRASKNYKKCAKNCEFKNNNNNCIACSELKKKFVALRNEYRKMHKILYDSYIEQVENELKVNPKRFFEFVNMKKKTAGFPSKMTLNDMSASTPLSICNLFANFFDSVYVEPDVSSSEYIARDTGGVTLIDSLEFDMAEVEKALLSLDPKKGAGPDGIPTFILKECAFGFATPLTKLFNASIRFGEFPELWKSSFIVPIFKNGARNKIENYRGIAILSAIPKLFEKLVVDRIYFKLKEKITINQHGFMKCRSAVSNLMEFTSFCVKAMENGCQVDAVYTDFSKAFDRLNHLLLLKKLRTYGFVSRMYRWIESYLTGRTQTVRVGDFESKIIQVRSGVPQGSHLGPLLFLLFINDILDSITSVQALLYADDLKLYCVIKDENDCLNLQRDLDNLTEWCEVNKLYLNISKCKVISFGRKLTPIWSDYILNGQMLERVETMNDLGVLLDKKLNFIDHIDSIVARARKMLGFIMRVAKEFNDPFVLKCLYCSLVRSKLEFASCVWNPYYSVHENKIERVQKKFIRFALRRLGWMDERKNKFPPYESRCKLLTLDTLKKRRKIGSAMFMRDILTARNDSPNLLRMANITVGYYRTRSTDMLYIDTHNTNYGTHGPFNSVMSNFNAFSRYFDFSDSRDSFLKALKENIKD